MQGGCLCGSVRYRVSGSPLDSAICHCHSCRKASGAPSVAWVTFDRSQVELLAGEPVEFSSSPGVVRRFCGKCGTGVSYVTTRFPDLIDITTASLDDAAACPPTAEVWVEDRLSWEPLSSSLAQHAKGSLDG